jgi:hypothetical protein
MRHTLAQSQTLFGLSLALCFMLSGPATAAVIQIKDLTDVVTATDNGTSSGRFATVGSSCTSTEECIFSISAPTGGAGVISIVVSPNVAINIFDDQSMTTVSDTFQPLNPSTCGLTQPGTCFQFDSDREAPLSALPTNVSIVENGLFQTAYTISYLNGNVSLGNDTVMFQSDIDSTGTPEPATVAITMGGLALLGVCAFRRLSVMRTR